MCVSVCVRDKERGTTAAFAVKGVSAATVRCLCCFNLVVLFFPPSDMMVNVTWVPVKLLALTKQNNLNVLKMMRVKDSNMPNPMEYMLS